MEPISRANLELVYDWAFGVAAQLVRKREQVAPVVLACRFINGKMRAAKLYAIEMAKPEHKDAAAEFIKAMITRPQVDIVCFVTEGWYVGAKIPDLQAGKPDALRAAARLRAQIEAGGIIPSQHPERQECVNFMFYTKLYDCIAFCHIDREQDKLERGELEFTLGHTVGRFTRHEDWNG